MNAQKLSKRLELVASFVPTGAVVADIGSDHAYLPCYLVQRGIISQAIAGEVVKGPYESALRQVRAQGLLPHIHVRLADGLAAIEENDGVDTITIAGMGGPLIVSILEKHPEVLRTVTRLILQPNIHAKVIRQWALANGWAILDEMIVEEDEKIYEILVLQKGAMTLNTAEILLGPQLMIQGSAVFKKKWTKEVENWHKILQDLHKAEASMDVQKKREELLQFIQLVEGVLKK